MGNAKMPSDTELLTSLQELSNNESDNGETAGEIAERLGKDTTWVRKRLAVAKSKGMLVVGKASRARLDGLEVRVPVYVVKVPPSNAKKSSGRRPVSTGRR